MPPHPSEPKTVGQPSAPTSLSVRLLVAALLALSGCGTLPQPFLGRPGATAMRLSVPPPSRLAVPVPASSLLTADRAALWSRLMAAILVQDEIPAFATAPNPGDWRLALSASFAPGGVVPRYTVVDFSGHSRGEVLGAPVPLAEWAAAAPPMLAAQSAQVAPKVVQMLTAIDARTKETDPNSLYNRPARVYLAAVTGAPGDGNAALLRGMRAKLPTTGDVLADRAVDADFTVRGTVRMTDEPDHQQQIEIHWIVSDSNGRMAGDVAQGHDLAKGTLDGLWGEIADAITDEAAGGVHDVITNFSGRRKGAA